jgi:hypothetical protein
MKTVFKSLISQEVTQTFATSGESSPKPNTAAIVGGVIGASALFIIIAVSVVFLLRRQKSKSRAIRANIDGDDGANLVVNQPMSYVSDSHQYNSGTL